QALYTMLTYIMFCNPLVALYASDVVLLLFNAPPPPEIYTLSLHDALPICRGDRGERHRSFELNADLAIAHRCAHRPAIARRAEADRKSTRLNSSHVAISYAVFCLKKKKTANDHSPHSAPFRLHDTLSHTIT